jgi:hypothetical protein
VESQTMNSATMTYEPGWLCEGGFQFKKHYFGPKPGELPDKRADGQLREESFKCAQYLDDLPEVKFWARNLSRRTTSFRLQSATSFTSILFPPSYLTKKHEKIPCHTKVTAMFLTLVR